MRRPVLLALPLLAALGFGCGSGEDSGPRLVVVGVWSGVEVEQLHIAGATYDTTPVLTQLADDQLAPGTEPNSELETTPEFASILTGLAPREHGLTSLHEPGRERLRPDVATLAEGARARGWRTLASVSSAKFSLAGLERGFDVWRAPSLEERRRDAAEVAAAIEADLESALESERRVLLVLHFEDLRGDDWRHSEQTDAFFEQRMSPFRGKGGPVDDAYEATEEERTLVSRLRRRLYRQGAGPARAALEASLYGARLMAVDAAFESVRARARSARASIDWLMLGRDLWVATPGAAQAWPSSSLAAEPLSLSQRVRVRNTTPLEVNVGWHATGAVLEGVTAGGDAGAAKSSQSTTLEGVGEVGYRLSSRGAPLRLTLQGDVCRTEDVWLGALPVAQTDVCELSSRNAFDWPEDLDQEPALELRSLGGRREELLVNGSGAVRLVLESFPASAELLETLAGQALEVSEHPYRADCAVVSGSAPLRFELPARIPSARPGIALFLDGERVSGARMKNRGKVFSVPGRVELALSPGCWLDPALRGSAPEDSGARVAVELHDPLPALEEYRHPTREERAFLARVDDE